MLIVLKIKHDTKNAKQVHFELLSNVFCCETVIAGPSDQTAMVFCPRGQLIDTYCMRKPIRHLTCVCPPSRAVAGCCVFTLALLVTPQWANGTRCWRAWLFECHPTRDVRMVRGGGAFVHLNFWCERRGRNLINQPTDSSSTHAQRTTATDSVRTSRTITRSRVDNMHILCGALCVLYIQNYSIH